MFQAIFKSLHISKLNELVCSYNQNHAPCPVPQTHELTNIQTPTQGNDPELLTYDKISEKLEQTLSLVGPTLPHFSKHPVMLLKKPTKQSKKELKQNFKMYNNLKSKMLPVDRKVFLKKKTDKQVKSNQIYDIFNNYAPLGYFL